MFKSSLTVNFLFAHFHLNVGENSLHDSPDRQTFVTEGWFAAGDFLQRQKHVKHPEVYQMTRDY